MPAFYSFLIFLLIIVYFVFIIEGLVFIAFNYIFILEIFKILNNSVLLFEILVFVFRV